MGTGTIAPRLIVYKPFKEARKFARGLGLKSYKEWLAFCRGQLPEKGFLPIDIPTNPDQTHKGKGWQSWGDWLGTRTIASISKVYRPLDETQQFTNDLSIKSNFYRSFDEAREFVRCLGFKGNTEWRSYCKGLIPEKGFRPDDIPANPNQTYIGKGWQSWGDWFGTGTIATYLKVYRPFDEAREFVRGLGLKSQGEWRSYCKGLIPEKGALPDDIPANPDRTYKDNGWQNWENWL